MGPANYKCPKNLVTLIHVCPATSVTKGFERPSRKPYQKQLAQPGEGGQGGGGGGEKKGGGGGGGGWR